jgi:hypothetical protein
LLNGGVLYLDACPGLSAFLAITKIAKDFAEKVPVCLGFGLSCFDLELFL